jgi:hypothetical protein
MFPILPGMDFTWLDPEGTVNRRWRAVMPKAVFQQVVDLKLFGGNPPPNEPPMFGRRPRQVATKPLDFKAVNKARRKRRLAKVSTYSKERQP